MTNTSKMSKSAVSKAARKAAIIAAMNVMIVNQRKPYEAYLVNANTPRPVMRARLTVLLRNSRCYSNQHANSASRTCGKLGGAAPFRWYSLKEFLSDVQHCRACYQVQRHYLNYSLWVSRLNGAWEDASVISGAC